MRLKKASTKPNLFDSKKSSRGVPVLGFRIERPNLSISPLSKRSRSSWLQRQTNTTTATPLLWVMFTDATCGIRTFTSFRAVSRGSRTCRRRSSSRTTRRRSRGRAAGRIPTCSRWAAWPNLYVARVYVARVYVARVYVALCVRREGVRRTMCTSLSRRQGSKRGEKEGKRHHSSTQQTNTLSTYPLIPHRNSPQGTLVD